MELLGKVFRFSVVGVVTALLYYGLLYFTVEYFAVNATLASSFIYVLVVIFNYLMHHSWTFSQSAPHSRTLSRYLLMVFCGFLINGLIMYIGVTRLELNYLLVQTAAIALVILWNFSVAFWWVFRP